MIRRVLFWLALAVAFVAVMAEPKPELSETQYAASLWGVKLVAGASLCLLWQLQKRRR